MSMLQVLFERVFLSRVLKPLFVSADDSVQDWRFRWQLDRYVSQTTDGLFIITLHYIVIPHLEISACDWSKFSHVAVNKSR